MKYTGIIETLQHKMDKHLLEDSEEDTDADDAVPSSFEERLNSATDYVLMLSVHLLLF
jgi:hypothetical protein